jgi:excisionase family DNA binding protein
MERISEMPEVKIPQLFTVAQVAHCLALSRSKIYAMMDAGRLPYVKLGRSRRIKSTDVVDVVNANTRGGNLAAG